MNNIQGTAKDLELYNEGGKLVYEFETDSNGYSSEFTRDENGNVLTYKNSDGFSYETTYDSNGKALTYKNTDGFSYERIYNSNGKVLTYKNSNGFSYERTYNESGAELTYKDSNGVSSDFEKPTKQTAVEWLSKQQFISSKTWKELIDEAKEMEKEQITNAFVECWKTNMPDGIECKLSAVEYYNQTFKSK